MLEGATIRGAVSGPLRTLLALAVLAVPGVTHAGTMAQGVASVIDGDTIEIHGQRIRLSGIDAPESSQVCLDSEGRRWRCGQQAALRLADKIDRGVTRCMGDASGRYGRLIATCTHHGVEVNRWMVRRGWAMAYRSYTTRYVAEESQARLEGVGIWSGHIVPPWEWRQGARLRFDGDVAQPSVVGQDKDCGDFRTQAEAQTFFLRHRPGDPHRLDRNGDAVACEDLP